MEKFKSNPLVKTLGFNRIILVGVLILLYLLFSLFSGRVLGAVDIQNVLNSVDFMGFLTIGVMFVNRPGDVLCSTGGGPAAGSRRSAFVALPADQHPGRADLRYSQRHYGRLYEASFLYFIHGLYAYRPGHRLPGNEICRRQLAQHRLCQ